MAITNLIITQSNIEGAVNLLAAHSDIFFLCEATYTGVEPKSLGVNVYDSDDLLIKQFRAITDVDKTTEIRSFYFESGVLIRALLPAFDDEFQGEQTILECTNMTKILKLEFYDPDETSTVSDIIEVNFTHAATQVGSSVALESEYNNEEKTVYCVKDSHCYTYFYNKTANTTVTVKDESGISLVSLLCENVGYYRYKETFTNVTSGLVRSFFDGVDTFIRNIIVLDVCNEGKEIKYLDTKGQYRFFGFNKYFQNTDSSKSLGTVLKQSLVQRTAQSKSQSLGYSNTIKMSLQAMVSNEELETLLEINVSPRIYLRVDNTADSFANWLEVVRTGGTSERNRPHVLTAKYSLELSLGAQNTITML